MAFYITTCMENEKKKQNKEKIFYGFELSADGKLFAMIKSRSRIWWCIKDGAI